MFITHVFSILYLDFRFCFILFENRSLISKRPHWLQRIAYVNPWPGSIKGAQTDKSLTLPSYSNAFHSFCREFAGGTLTMTTHVNIIGYTQYWERNVNLVRPAGCKADRRRLGYHDRCRIIFGPPSLKVRPDQILYKKRSGFYKKRSGPYKKRSTYKKRSGVEECCIFNLKMNF